MAKEPQILFNHNYFQISRIENNIINVHHKKGVMTIDIYKELIEFVKNLAKEQGIYVLNTQDAEFSFKSETWRYIQKEAPTYNFITAQALVITVLHLRILGKFLVTILKNRNKTKDIIVSSREAGVLWLKEQMTLDESES